MSIATLPVQDRGGSILIHLMQLGLDRVTDSVGVRYRNVNPHCGSALEYCAPESPFGCPRSSFFNPHCGSALPVPAPQSHPIWLE